MLKVYVDMADGTALGAIGCLTIPEIGSSIKVEDVTYRVVDSSILLTGPFSILNPPQMAKITIIVEKE